MIGPDDGSLAWELFNELFDIRPVARLCDGRLEVMDIEPIKTQRDYRRVLKEIEGLMMAKHNTAEGDRLSTPSFALSRHVGVAKHRVAAIINRQNGSRDCRPLADVTRGYRD
jgi:hypothetical protein